MGKHLISSQQNKHKRIRSPDRQRRTKKKGKCQLLRVNDETESDEKRGEHSCWSHVKQKQPSVKSHLSESTKQVTAMEDGGRCFIKDHQQSQPSVFILPSN